LKENGLNKNRNEITRAGKCGRYSSGGKSGQSTKTLEVSKKEQVSVGKATLPGEWEGSQ